MLNELRTFEEILVGHGTKWWCTASPVDDQTEYIFRSGCEQSVFSFRSTDTNVLNRPDEADLFNLSFARSPHVVFTISVTLRQLILKYVTVTV